MEMSWRLQRTMVRDNLNELSDEELYRLSYKNPSAFELLIVRYEGYIMRYCRYLANSEEDAKDLFQESVWKMYLMSKKRQKLESFKPYARKVVMNLFIDRYRKKKGTVSLTDMEEAGYEPKDDSLLRDVENREGIEALKQYLSPEERLLVALRYEDGLSYAEISEEVGLSEVAVRQRISRIKKKLLAKLS